MSDTQPNEQLIEDAVAALVAFEGSESAEEILITVREIHVHSVLWLRALLEENKRLKEISIDATRDWARVSNESDDLRTELEQTREELEQAKRQIEWLKQIDAERDGDFEIHANSLRKKCAELEQVKAERDEYRKVLQFSSSLDARSILSQYRGDTHE